MRLGLRYRRHSKDALKHKQHSEDTNMTKRYLPFGMKSKPFEKIDPDDEEQTSLFDFEQ